MKQQIVRYRARPDLIVETIEDECVVLDMERNTYFGLNAVGRVLVAALQDDARAVEALVVMVVERFDVSEDQARADVASFMAELVDAGLVVAEELEGERG